MGLGPLDVPARAGVAEIRAMYGGLELGLAAFFVWSALAEERVRTGLLAAVLTIGLLGAARLLGIVVDRPEGALIPLFACLELGGAAAGAWVLWRLGPAPRGAR